LVSKENREKSTDAIGNEIKKFVQTIPGVKVRVNPIGFLGTANQTPIQLIVEGSDRNDVQKASETVQNIVKTIPGTTDVRISSENGNPETQIDIDRQKLANLGLSIADVGSVLNVAYQGNDDSKYRDGDDDYNIKISLDKFDRSKISDLENLTFINKSVQSIQLMQFANVYQTTGPTKLQRVNRIPSVTVYSQVIGRPTGSIGADIKKAVEKAGLPKGIDVLYWGDLKNQTDSFSSLGLALLAAIIFVYMVMVALYDSYFDPFVILFSIPLAMIGALLALALFMKSLNIFSILGVIMLIGLVGKNAILLVDRTGQRKREGDSTYDALIEAGKSRIRPIMMTTAAMIFGMLPIATSGDAGSEWKSGLAWAIIGGLISSLFLTLVIVPVIYSIAEGYRDKLPLVFAKLFSKKGKTAEPEADEDLGLQEK
jgi:HAE1 family hydrophobic/amphiphilic exporter-1